MGFLKLTGAVATIVLLAGCGTKVGKGEEAGEPAGNAVASAEGKSEEGKISLKAPGFDIAFNLPEGVSEHMNVDTDSKILYPGAAIGGMHIAAGTQDAKGGGKGEVELRFTTPDAPDKVAAWYRDPARAEGFALTSDAREGQGFVIAGTTKGDVDGFKVHIGAKDGGGTEGRLIVHDRS